MEQTRNEVCLSSLDFEDPTDPGARGEEKRRRRWV